MKPHKNRARTMSDPQVLGRSVIRASPKKQLLEAGSHTDTQEGYNPFKHSRDDMPLIRKNKSFTDNEAGSQNSTEERVLDLKKIVPQIKEFREKKTSKPSSSNSIKPKSSGSQVIPEVNIEIDPGMEAGSQTSEIEQSRSPTKHSALPIPKGKKTKTIPTYRTEYTYKKDAKRIQKNSLTSFNSSTGLAIEAGSETSPGYHPMISSYNEQQLPNTTTSRKYLNIKSSSITNKGGTDFGTNAASGNDSVGFENFELVYEAEIAYFQKNFDLLERERENYSSDTDGSKAISEGSSTAEGAASAAEGHHEFYFQ